VNAVNEIDDRSVVKERIVFDKKLLNRSCVVMAMVE